MENHTTSTQKMSAADADFALALALQQQEGEGLELDGLEEDGLDSSLVLIDEASSSVGGGSAASALSMLRGLGPSPDVRTLFQAYNSAYFHGALGGVECRWSLRMTLCAGLCVYESRGGYCSVRLSEPLLKFRPQSDLVDTLLHEMIHAFLFVTSNDRDRDAHGPRFLAHMRRINAAAGTSISVHHSFLDEVDHYRTHVWQCTGPCRTRPPYHGLVKRAMNRPPSPADPWWARHASECGGAYIKIAEPTASVAPRSRPAAAAVGSSSFSSAASSASSSSRQQPEGQRTLDDLFLKRGTGAAASGARVSEATQLEPRHAVAAVAVGMKRKHAEAAAGAGGGATGTSVTSVPGRPLVKATTGATSRGASVSEAVYVSASDDDEDRYYVLAGDGRAATS